jgi:steroid 5-alpha reductase family enzyme
MYITHATAFAVLIVVSAKTLAWLVQLRLKNAGLVDPIWAWTLGFLAVFYALVGDAPVALRVLLALMGGFWGLRLGTHLFIRNWNQPEDWRYARFRKDWGAQANRNMFWFFQFQNIFTLLLSSFAFLPIAFRSDAPPLSCWALALLIWNVAVIGEGMADAQMERFRGNKANHGLVCRDGLWRYSRHPNYFFESLHWAAYIPLAIGAPYGWISVLAPVVMALLLMKLSGVPMLEEEMIKRKPGYADYVRDTSALIPWPPKPHR